MDKAKESTANKIKKNEFENSQASLEPALCKCLNDLFKLSLQTSVKVNAIICNYHANYTQAQQA